MKSINLPQYIIWLLIACFLVAGWFFFPGLGQELALAGHHNHRSRVHAPDFPKGAQCLNVSRPLALEDLKGKVVLLDFWTYACINCMHVLPDLHYLEEKYGDSLAVIGVHSAKFVNERESDNIRQAILRYEIAHPVINDSGFVLWRTYGVRAWPTAVVIDPAGYVVGGLPGEGNRAGLIVPDGKERGHLMDVRLPLEIPYTRQNNGVGHFTVDLTLYYCRKDNRGTCHIKDLQWRPEVRTDGPETKRARLAYAVPPRRPIEGERRYG